MIVNQIGFFVMMILCSVLCIIGSIDSATYSLGLAIVFRLGIIEEKINKP